MTVNIFAMAMYIIIAILLQLTHWDRLFLTYGTPPEPTYFVGILKLSYHCKIGFKYDFLNIRLDLIEHPLSPDFIIY